jgi:hypothetical protein
MLSMDILTSLKILSPHQSGHLEFALLVSSHAPTYELVFSCLCTHCLVSIQSLGLKVNYVGVNHGNGYKLFLNLSSCICKDIPRNVIVMWVINVVGPMCGKLK